MVKILLENTAVSSKYLNGGFRLSCSDGFDLVNGGPNRPSFQ